MGTVWHWMLTDDGEVVPAKDVLDWADNQDAHKWVADEQVNGCRIATIFIGLNVYGNDADPLLFETMVFSQPPARGALDRYTRHYATLAEAKAGHAETVRTIQLSFFPKGMNANYPEMQPPKLPPQQPKLRKNAAKCGRCGEVIESKDMPDLVYCKCKGIFVDGGLEYTRRGNEPGVEWEELSEYEPVTGASTDSDAPPPGSGSPS